jgi:hypothetical protein
MVSEQSYMSAMKWSLVVNSHLRVAIGHPFLAVGGLKEAPGAPVMEHVTPFNTARRRHSGSFNEKLKLVGALNVALAA